jgi:hypothetical protein
MNGRYAKYVIRVISSWLGNKWLAKHFVTLTVGGPPGNETCDGMSADDVTSRRQVNGRPNRISPVSDTVMLRA